MAEERDKSLIRKYAERKAKKSGKKLAKKAAKAAARLVKKASKLAIHLIGKALLWFAGTVGLPVVLIGFGLIIFIVIFLLFTAQYINNGEDEDALKIKNYIETKCDQTVDMKRSEQLPYRVPGELVISTLQLQIYKLDENEVDRLSDGDGINYTARNKRIVDRLTELLKPEFEYTKYTEIHETKVTTCTDGSCSSSVTAKEVKVDKLTYVDAWNQKGSFEYKLVQHPYRQVSSYTYTTSCGQDEEDCTPSTTTITTEQREKQADMVSSNVSPDFTRFDNQLNSYGASPEDKKLVEIIAEGLGLRMGYSDWLNGTGFIGGGGFNGTITPGSNVPSKFMPIYLDAEKKYGVDWYMLAAIHFVESSFSDSNTGSNVSSVGAIGPMQFMPRTWIGWSYKAANSTSLGNATIPYTDLTNPKIIKKYNGYGTDGNGDGKADPWSVEDAIHAAAYYLSKSGYAKDQRKAIWNYNHADWYVLKVLDKAKEIQSAATYLLADGEVPINTKGDFTLPCKCYGTSPYGPRWGSFHQGIDLGANGQPVPIIAAADGQVTRSYSSSSYGETIFISHNINGKKYTTVYAHMVAGSRRVYEGALVKKGQVIGNMGNTGFSTGVHLHFEIHSPTWTQGGPPTSLNPARYVSISFK